MIISLCRSLAITLVFGATLLNGDIGTNLLYDHSKDQEQWKEEYQRLHPLDKAIHDKDLTKIKELLDSGIPFDHDFDFYTALLCGATDIVKELVTRGADVNKKFYTCDTALTMAISRYFEHNERYGMAEFLLAHSADCNVSGQFGTPLMRAASDNRLDLVQLFLNHGADVNKTRCPGYTALMSAARYGDLEIVQLLLAKGADCNAQEFMYPGFTALHEACLSDNPDRLAIIKELIAHGAHVNALNGNGSTALIYAARHGSLDLVKELLMRGSDADIQETDSYEHTALTYTLSIGVYIDPIYIEIAKALIEHGVNLNARKITNRGVSLLQYDGRSPLRLATEAGLTEIVDLLKKHGATE